MQQNDTKFYTLGRGKLFLDLFLPGSNVGTGERYLGNTPEVGINTSSEKLDHFYSDAGMREKDLTVLLETSTGGSFTTDVISPENMALFFMGGVNTATHLEQQGFREVFVNWARGRTLQIGTTEDVPTGARNIDSVKMFKAAKNATVDLNQTLVGQAGVTEVPMDGNWDVDLALGRVYIEGGSAEFTGDIKILVECDIKAQTRKTIISGNDMLYGALRYIADNPVGENRDMFWPKVALTPDGDYALKGDEWQQISFSFDALKLLGRKLVYADIRESTNTEGQGSLDIRSVNVIAAKTAEAHGTPVTVTVTVRDGANNIVPGEAVTLTASNGGILVPVGGNTGVDGRLTCTVDLAAAGTTTVTATVTTSAGVATGHSQAIVFS